MTGNHQVGNVAIDSEILSQIFMLRDFGEAWFEAEYVFEASWTYISLSHVYIYIIIIIIIYTLYIYIRYNDSYSES